MDLPAFRRGLELVSADLNKLSNAVRSASVTSVIGGTFNRTPGGTTIVVDQQVRGGGSPSLPCPFKVTDVSEPKPNGGLIVKIQISQDPILGTISDDYPDGRYPDGMSGDPNAPAYKITLSDDPEFVYVYVNVLVDQLAEILPATTAITISVDKEFTQGSSTYQKYLVAIVEKKLDDAGNAYISEIQNLCPVVFAHPAPFCPFLVEDDSRDGVARVTVRSGLVANALPDNMTLNDTFTITLATTQSFWVIYCGMVVNNGVIQTGPGNITIFASDSYQDNTSTYVYFKLAQLNLSQRANGDWYASYILNTCAVPFVAGGGSACDYFAVTDATEGTDLKVQVAQNLIAGRYPDGMGNGFPPFILQISQSCYIYAAIYWDISTLTIGSDSSAITILQSNDLLQNTGTMQYILIATVTVGGSPEAITSIANVCSQPQPNPCLLDWSS
jgi:hypothetical protein